MANKPKRSFWTGRIIEEDGQKVGKQADIRRGRCQWCQTKGSCGCQQQQNILAERGDGPTVCTQMCQGPKKPACGKTTRSGRCPCAYC